MLWETKSSVDHYLHTTSGLLKIGQIGENLQLPPSYSFEYLKLHITDFYQIVLL